MNKKCGYILHELCCCDDMECYGEKCEYEDDINCCPVHFEFDCITEDSDIIDTLDKELRLNIDKINLYKQEVTNLRSQVELQNKIIDRLSHCIVECDPWVCENMKERLKNGQC